MKDIELIKEYFKNDRFATKNGMYIKEVCDEYAICAMKITEEHKNALGAVMGGVFFTLADFAFAVASNSNGIKTVSLNNNISFLTQPKGEYIYAKAILIKAGKTISNYSVDIYDDKNIKVATCSVTGYHI